LTVVLFLLFPRIQGPLWGLPNDANAGRTGLSDQMAPGNIAKLAMSREIAFRAQFSDVVPPNSALYWRGIVLDRFDGKTWTHRPMRYDEQHTANTLTAQGNPLRYRITQEPGSRPWLFALDMPQAAPQLPDNPVRLTQDMQLLARRPIDA